jgi:hypothetical protein
MRPISRTRTSGITLAVVAGLVLTGCAAELPEPVEPPAPSEPPPATTLDQSQRVLTEVGEVLAAGDAAASADPLRPRVSGPALTARTAEYAVATATAGSQPVTPLPVEPQTLVIPSTTEWPRNQVVVTEQPDDLTSPRLLVLRQESPRAPYTLWAWARLLPGAQTPAMATPDTGSAPLPPDAPDLVATPADVVTQYADVLTNGDASAFAASFATPDPYRERLAAGRAQFQQIASQASGSYTETYAPVPDQLVAHETADGGALVVAGMTTASNLTISGASLTVPAEFAAVSGGALPPNAVLRNSLAVGYTDIVAFYVPPADAAAPVQVLGAEHTFTSASGS